MGSVWKKFLKFIANKNNSYIISGGRVSQWR